MTPTLRQSARWLDQLAEPERRIDLVGGLTLVILLLTTEKTWGLQIALVSLVAAAAVDRQLLRRAGYWAAVLAVYVVGVSTLILRIDNHEFLLAYWLLALALSRRLDDPAAGLATSARLLIGWAFAFAVLWKAVTPEYFRGDAFHGFLLVDPRFAGLGALVSDLTLADGQRTQIVSNALRTVGDLSVSLPVASAPGVRQLAVVMTWWTLGIEALVAVCFLAPVRLAVGQARHIALLVFLFTTYLMAPVLGFGWILIALGVAQSPLERSRWLLPAYAAAFVLVLTRSTAPLDSLLALF